MRDRASCLIALQEIKTNKRCWWKPSAVSVWLYPGLISASGAALCVQSSVCMCLYDTFSGIQSNRWNVRAENYYSCYMILHRVAELLTQAFMLTQWVAGVMAVCAPCVCAACVRQLIMCLSASGLQTASEWLRNCPEYDGCNMFSLAASVQRSMAAHATSGMSRRRCSPRQNGRLSVSLLRQMLISLCVCCKETVDYWFFSVKPACFLP